MKSLKDIVDNVKVLKDNRLQQIIKLWKLYLKSIKQDLQIILNQVAVQKSLKKIIIYAQKFGALKVKYQ